MEGEWWEEHVDGPMGCTTPHEQGGRMPLTGRGGGLGPLCRKTTQLGVGSHFGRGPGSAPPAGMQLPANAGFVVRVMMWKERMPRRQGPRAEVAQDWRAGVGRVNPTASEGAEMGVGLINDDF